MYDAYLFDLDGTLIDTAPDLHFALNKTLAKWQHPTATLQLARRWVGHGAKAMITNALLNESQKTPDEQVVEAMYLDFLEYYKADIANVGQPYPSVRLVIQYLFRRKTRLGVVTNKRFDLTTILFQKLNLSNFFEVIVGGDTLTEQKPSPKPIEYACMKLHSNPSNTLYIGDSRTDVLSARAAGCPVVLVPYGYNDDLPVTTLGADKVIHSFLELIE
ncbi:MAG: phosphoglycolate phosphatase [Gammaproteobacteria bacterium]|nr:phosphoglycolate phosphatase [Gammaproteobacteria bacterium]MXX94260.1 phosphoglycolate phosphatase [Gammaproteobacteria bacterium]MYF52471.1 phosphoglycolate phosphatase [Gammaproteobacteria bacterium]MYK43650.1 phosphoglycolate phosphatase [Gammaproteobacteria bacterium]